MWCLNNQNNNFDNYVFADECTIRLNEFPRNPLRLPSSYPDGIEGGDKYFYKINLFGAISCKGPSQFYVISLIKKIYFLKFKISILKAIRRKSGCITLL